jgi:CRP-like cAMP-binding protein
VDWSLYLLGLFWGAVSAVSLPVGAVAGFLTHPSRRLTSGLMAFGGGALLFALSIELFGHALHVAGDGYGRIVHPGIVIAAIVAAVAGGITFRALNYVLNSRGGYRRKRSLIRREIAAEKHRAARRLLKDLSRIPLFRHLPADEFVRLLPGIEREAHGAGTVLFEEGAEGDRLYSVLEGTVTIRHRNSGGEVVEVSKLGPGEIFGEIALISDRPRTAAAVADTDVLLLAIHRTDFERLLVTSPQTATAMRRIAADRLHELASLRSASTEDASAWEEQALSGLSSTPIGATEEEIAREASEHEGEAALTIWLGIALDGIPESLVIGLLVVAAAAEGRGMSLAFIAGVFLANLPEAMSSSVTMREGGMAFRRVFWMWMSLCILTALGAFLGAMIFPPHPEGWMLYAVFAIEGLAGGAMLTMIAETMLPEAFEQGGGPLVGLSTLAGFLAALAVKLLY